MFLFTHEKNLVLQIFFFPLGGKKILRTKTQFHTQYSVSQLFCFSPVLRWSPAGWSLHLPAVETLCMFCYTDLSARNLLKENMWNDYQSTITGDGLVWIIILILSFSDSPSPSSSSSLLSLLVSRSHSDETVSMKAKPMKRDVFWGSGPWVSATSQDRPGRSVPLPEVLHTPTRWAEDRTTCHKLSDKITDGLKRSVQPNDCRLLRMSFSAADCSVTWRRETGTLFLETCPTVVATRICKDLTCMSEWNEILLSVIWLNRPF